MNAKTKKIATAATAVVLSAALLLGGTFAWQSVNQTALNVAEEEVNPGGRLHDDFNGTNKDVYVENFTDAENGGQVIYARVRLDEYLHLSVNGGDPDVLGTNAQGEVPDLGATSTYITYLPGEDSLVNTDSVIRDYVEWSFGGSTTYLPTFNMNKDSLVADVNGTIEGEDGVYPSDPEDKYSDYTEYEVDADYDGYEVTDNDTNDADELSTAVETAVEDGNIDGYEDYVAVSEQTTHTAKATSSAMVMTMEEWLALSEDEQVGDYWVYDTDGWAYYARGIEPGEATGLLLTGIEVNTDDSYRYELNVVSQFVTANDLGREDGTGFYDTDMGTEPSENALTLLEAIGVNISAGDEESEEDEEPVEGALDPDMYGFGRLVEDDGEIYYSTSLPMNASGIELLVLYTDEEYEPANIGEGELVISIDPDYADDYVQGTVVENNQVTLGVGETAERLYLVATLDGEEILRDSMRINYGDVLNFSYYSGRSTATYDTSLAPGMSVKYQLTVAENFSSLPVNYTFLDYYTDEALDPQPAGITISEPDEEGIVTITHTCASVDDCQCTASLSEDNAEKLVVVSASLGEGLGESFTSTSYSSLDLDTDPEPIAPSSTWLVSSINWNYNSGVYDVYLEAPEVTFSVTPRDGRFNLAELEVVDDDGNAVSGVTLDGTTVTVIVDELSGGIVTFYMTYYLEMDGAYYNNEKYQTEFNFYAKDYVAVQVDDTYYYGSIIQQSPETITGNETLNISAGGYGDEEVSISKVTVTSGNNTFTAADAEEQAVTQPITVDLSAVTVDWNLAEGDEVCVTVVYGYSNYDRYFYFVIGE